MRLKPLLRATRLFLLRRIDCAPRLGRFAPYAELDATVHGSVVVEPVSSITDHVWYGPGRHHFFPRYTPYGLAWLQGNVRNPAFVSTRRRFRDQPETRA